MFIGTQIFLCTEVCVENSSIVRLMTIHVEDEQRPYQSVTQHTCRPLGGPNFWPHSYRVLYEGPNGEICKGFKFVSENCDNCSILEILLRKFPVRPPARCLPPSLHQNITIVPKTDFNSFFSTLFVKTFFT
jgi:hypothetical protein